MEKVEGKKKRAKNEDIKQKESLKFSVHHPTNRMTGRCIARFVLFTAFARKNMGARKKRRNLEA